MRVVDRRIRTVARAVGYRHAPHPLHDRPVDIYVWPMERRNHRRTAIAAAVRVLEALDTDITEE